MNVEQLSKFKPGDMFETGTMMKGVSEEPIVWVVKAAYDSGRGLPIVGFSLYWFDVRIASLEAEATSKERIQWKKH